MQVKMSKFYSALNYFNSVYEILEPQLAFKAKNKVEWQQWRQKLVDKLVELLGGFPAEKVSLEAEVLEEVEEEHYRRRKVVFWSDVGRQVPAYLLVPKDVTFPTKALLCCHGHDGKNREGKGSVTGITDDPEYLQFIKDTNYDYAAQFAKKGYITMAADALGFGERAADFLRFDGPRDGCNVIFILGLLLGINLLTLNIWDLMRCIDYLQSLDEVDGDRIGCVGLSYGGTQTLFLVAIDERIKAAVVSCYLNTFKVYALDLANTCGVQTIPNLLKYAEMADIAALIAPRPVLFESGLEDTGFPIEAARAAFKVVKQAYELLGVPEKVAMDEFAGGHQFSGRKAFEWFDKWL